MGLTAAEAFILLAFVLLMLLMLWRAESEDAARATVAAALRDELGAVVAARGGEIAADGALVFPDKVLFDVGSAVITPELEAFLGEICLPWFRTLESSDIAISELRIEGHASSEWDRATPADPTVSPEPPSTTGADHA